MYYSTFVCIFKITIIMNKSNKTKREKELEKQVKDLRSERVQLKKQVKSLESRLETATKKSGQYKDELKKNSRRTEEDALREKVMRLLQDAGFMNGP